MSIAQGGSGLPFLSPNTYEYLTTGDISSVTPNSSEVPDSDVVDLITKVGEVNCN